MDSSSQNYRGSSMRKVSGIIVSQDGTYTPPECRVCATSILKVNALTRPGKSYSYNFEFSMPLALATIPEHVLPFRSTILPRQRGLPSHAHGGSLDRLSRSLTPTRRLQGRSFARRSRSQTPTRRLQGRTILFHSQESTPSRRLARRQILWDLAKKPVLLSLGRSRSGRLQDSGGVLSGSSSSLSLERTSGSAQIGTPARFSPTSTSFRSSQARTSSSFSQGYSSPPQLCKLSPAGAPTSSTQPGPSNNISLRVIQAQRFSVGTASNIPLDGIQSRRLQTTNSAARLLQAGSLSSCLQQRQTTQGNQSRTSICRSSSENSISTSPRALDGQGQSGSSNLGEQSGNLNQGYQEGYQEGLHNLPVNLPTDRTAGHKFRPIPALIPILPSSRAVDGSEVVDRFPVYYPFASTLQALVFIGEYSLGVYNGFEERLARLGGSDDYFQEQLTFFEKRFHWMTVQLQMWAGHPVLQEIVGAVLEEIRLMRELIRLSRTRRGFSPGRTLMEVYGPFRNLCYTFLLWWLVKVHEDPKPVIFFYNSSLLGA